MAFTVSREFVNISNKRVALISCSVDSASGNINTGLKIVEHIAFAPVSMANAQPIFKKNIGSGATSVPGNININGATSGDVFFLTVYGR